jgi:hypothetical protein
MVVWPGGQQVQAFQRQSQRDTGKEQGGEELRLTALGGFGDGRRGSGKPLA